MRVVDLIAKKRAGGEHTETEIHFLVSGYSQGSIPDYQMSAWLMAVLWRGLTDLEMFVLTEAMVASGETLALGDLAATAVDKHSTGGVGDKTTLAVVPILAAGGVTVAKMSGRGLGHTGGTLDKLDAIPGMRTSLSIEEILTQTRAVGACIAAQSDTLVPADRKMYALRDATSTVESLPLIAASIMSKKLAAGSRNIILDVKVGSGAFMKTLDEARALADAMVRIGEAHGRRVVALLSDMNVPLGYNIGNLLEVCEVVSLLRNNAGAEPRLRRVVKTLCGIGFVLADCAGTAVAGEAIAEELIVSGKGYEKLLQIVAAQGGDVACLEQTVKLPQCRVRRDIPAPRSGYVTALDAEAIGLTAMRLGAGRAKKEDVIDPAAGIMLRYALGDSVSKGVPLATLCASSEVQAREAEQSLVAAVQIGSEPSAARPLIYEIVGFS